MLGPQKVVTPESLLLDAAERLGRQRAGGVAVHFHLSRLRPQNREESRLRIVVRMLEGLMTAHRGQVFLLGNADIILLGQHVPERDLEAMLYKVRELFATDPLTFAEEVDGENRFMTRYDLGRDFPEFFDLVERLHRDAEARTPKPRADERRQATRPLDPKTLQEVLGRMGSLDMAKLVRRQPAVRVSAAPKAAVDFQEFFMSVGDLQKILAPDINLLSDRWLFQHLSETLDRRMLPVLDTINRCQGHARVSLNLNLSTVLGEDFSRFLKGVADKHTVIVEVQIVDIYHNVGNYLKARDILRERGHAILIDSLNPLTLHALEPALFEADLVKLMWTPELAEARDNAAVNAREMVEAVGARKVILARCDTEASIRWGLKEGIHTFQGRIVDAMMKSTDMSPCLPGKACAFGRCIAARPVDRRASGGG